MLWVLAAATLATALPAVPVDDAVRAALDHDPALAAAKAEVEAAGGDLRASRGVQYNPEIELGVLFGGPPGSTPRVEAQVMQPIPVSGEARHASRSARSRLESATAGLHRARLETAARARRVFLRRVVAAAGLRIAEQELAGASGLLQAAQARFAAGDVAMLDVQLARLEEAGAVAAWLEADAEATAARVGWAALTGLPTDGAVVTDPLAAAPALNEQGPEVRSDVAAAGAALVSAKAAVAREQSAGLPPIEIGAFVEGEAGLVFAGPRISLSLPVRNQNQRGIGAAQALLGRAQADVQALTAQAAAERASAAGAVESLERAVELLGDELPEAGAALVGVQRGYEVGEFDMGQVLLLRARIASGERGWYTARAAVAEGRIKVALARELSTLLPRE